MRPGKLQSCALSASTTASGPWTVDSGQWAVDGRGWMTTMQRVARKAQRRRRWVIAGGKAVSEDRRYTLQALLVPPAILALGGREGSANLARTVSLPAGCGQGSTMDACPWPARPDSANHPLEQWASTSKTRLFFGIYLSPRPDPSGCHQSSHTSPERALLLTFPWNKSPQQPPPIPPDPLASLDAWLAWLPRARHTAPGRGARR